MAVGPGPAARVAPYQVGGRVVSDDRWRESERFRNACHDPAHSFWDGFPALFDFVLSSNLPVPYHGAHPEADPHVVFLFEALRDVFASSSTVEHQPAWFLLFSLSRLLFSTGKQTSVAPRDLVHTRTELIYKGAWSELHAALAPLLRGPPPPPPSDPAQADTLQVKAALHQLRLGRPGRAMGRLLSHGVHPASAATRDAAAVKFPAALHPLSDADRSFLESHQLSPDAFAPQLCPEDGSTRPGLITLENIEKVLDDADFTKAAGITGMRLSLFTSLIRLGHSDILVNIVRAVASGRMPAAVRDRVLRRALLVPLKKGANSSDVRPILLQETLYTLTGATLLKHYRPRLNELFLDHQYAAGRKGGAEQLILLMSALHADQRHRRLHSRASPLLLLNIDVSNAFNAVSRRYVLEALVRQGFQGLIPLVLAKYGGVSEISLPRGSEPIAALLSREGVEQGDSLSSFLFAIVLVDVVAALRKARSVDQSALLSVFFADDGFLVGSPAVVLSALEFLSSLLSVGDTPVPARPLQADRPDHAVFSGTTGLSLSLPKCRVFVLGDGAGTSDVSRTTAAVLEALEQRGVHRVPGVTVLGTPVGTESFVQTTLAATLRDGVLAKIGAIGQLPDKFAAYHLLYKSVDMGIGHLLRTVPPSVIQPYAQQKDDAILAFFMSSADLASQHSAHARSAVFRRHDHGGFGCISSVATKEAAFLGSLAGNLQPLLATARRAEWPAFVIDALAHDGASDYWCAARSTWVTCAKAWDDGQQAAELLRTDHALDAGILPLKHMRPRTGTPASTSGTTSTTAPPAQPHDPAAPSTSGVQTRSQTAAARASPAPATAPAPEGTSVGPSEPSVLPSLESYVSQPYHYLQRAVTQRLNYFALQQSLCIPVNEDSPARRAAATSAANRIGRGTNPFQSSFAKAESLSPLFADAVHLWLGLPSAYHTICADAPCQCGVSANALLAPVDTISDFDKALAMRTHRIGCNPAGPRNGVHDAIVYSLYRMGVDAMGGRNMAREQKLPLPPGIGPTVPTPQPRADVLFHAMPRKPTDSSRTEQLVVEAKTTEALSKENLKYFDVQARSGAQVLKAKPLINLNNIRRDAARPYLELEGSPNGWIPAGARLVTVVADTVGTIDACLRALVYQTASVQIAQNKLVGPDQVIDKDTAGALTADLLGDLARGRLRAAVYAERNRLARQLNGHNGTYTLPSAQVLPVPGCRRRDLYRLSRCAARMRRQGELPHRAGTLRALSVRASHDAAPPALLA